MKPLKVVLIHEWFAKYGGSENVTRAILDVFVTQPDLYVLWSENDEITPTKTSFLNYFHFIPKPVKVLFSPIAHSIWRGEYDLIISSSTLCAHNAIVHGSRNSTNISYVHTPARYIWDLDVDPRLGLNTKKFLARLAIKLFKKYDRANIGRVNHYLANSSNVQSRILSYWGKDSQVLYPPVAIEFFEKFFSPNAPEQLLLISAGRLVRYKGHDIAIRVASQLKCKLIIAGDGPEKSNLESLGQQLGVDIEFHSVQTDELMAEQLRRASVFIHGGIEDFGILPIESIACGTPVVGFNKGGLSETINSSNGRLVNSSDEMARSVLEASRLPRKKVAATANIYSLRNFQQNFASYLISIDSDFRFILRDNLW